MYYNSSCIINSYFCIKSLKKMWTLSFPSLNTTQHNTELSRFIQGYTNTLDSSLKFKFQNAIHPQNKHFNMSISLTRYINRCMVESGVFSEVGDVTQHRDKRDLSCIMQPERSMFATSFIENKRVLLNISLHNTHLLHLFTMFLRKPWHLGVMYSRQHKKYSCIFPSSTGLWRHAINGSIAWHNDNIIRE